MEQHGATVLEYDVHGDEISVDLRLRVRPVVQRFDRQVAQCRGSAESCRELELTHESLRMRLRAERIEQRALLARLRRSLARLADGLVELPEVRPLVDPGGGPLGISVTFDDVRRYRQLQQDLEHSNQELETAMEELQSTNEELQATNEELQTLNEEFRERSTELDQLNAFLEGIVS